MPAYIFPRAFSAGVRGKIEYDRSDSARWSKFTISDAHFKVLISGYFRHKYSLMQINVYVSH